MVGDNRVLYALDAGVNGVSGKPRQQGHHPWCGLQLDVATSTIPLLMLMHQLLPLLLPLQACAQHHQCVCHGLHLLLPPFQPLCLPAVAQRRLSQAPPHARESGFRVWLGCRADTPAAISLRRLLMHVSCEFIRV